MRQTFLVLALLVLALPVAAADKPSAAKAPPGPPAAANLEAPHEYSTCLTLAKTSPEDGWEEALAWQSMGGGEAARHCAAVALIGMRRYEDAGNRLESLANESVRDDATRAEMFAQAGQAWLLLGNVQRADAAQRAALKLLPGAPELLLDHAVTLAQVHHYKEAVDELSDLLRRQPNRIEAMTLRASAYRYLDKLGAAEADLSRALELDPGFADALVERGMVRRLKGDTDGARADWLMVVKSVPSGPVLEEAQRNLELLDVKQK